MAMDRGTEWTDLQHEDPGPAPTAAVWLARKARLAAAVAVIKSRPPGVSGREHAEVLASRLRGRDDGWKSKVQELQEEVLHLRQQLLLAKMAAQMRDTGAASGDDFFMSDVGVLSRDLRIPAEKEGAVVDCGCGMETLLPRADPVNPQADPGASRIDPVNPAVPVAPQAPTSIPPRQFLPSQTCTLGKARSMFHHMQFLQSLCGLRRARGRGVCGRGAPGPAAWFGPEREDSSVMADSLCRLLDSVVAVCAADGPPLPSGDLVPEACRVLAGATDAWCLHQQPSLEFVAAVEVSLKELVGLMFHGDELGKGQASPGARLAEYLVLLGESGLLWSLLLRHLISLVNDLAERLCHLCQEHTDPEDDVLHLYENSFHLFWVLEKLLEARGSGVTHEAFLGHLNRSTLLLSDEFPLFALYMWRLGALLT